MSARAVAGVACVSLVLGTMIAAPPAATGRKDVTDAEASPTLFDAILCAFDPDGAPSILAEMASAHARMHRAMQDIQPSGDLERDFVRMMIPHHQGAIDMALIELRHGRDERLRRLAQAIIVEQGQEIAYMRTLLDKPPSAIGPDRLARR